MTAYRDGDEAARQRIATLEAKVDELQSKLVARVASLVAREAEIAELRGTLDRLNVDPTQRKSRGSRSRVIVMGVVAGLGVAVAVFVFWLLKPNVVSVDDNLDRPKAPPKQTSTADITATDQGHTAEAPAPPPTHSAPPTSPSQSCDCAPNDLMCNMRCTANTRQNKPEFSRDAARKVLRQATTDVQRCKIPNGPLGRGRVSVVFEPSGTVSSVAVGPPYVHTTVEACIAKTFGQISIPAFRGGSVTVSKSFMIQ